MDITAWVQKLQNTIITSSYKKQLKNNKKIAEVSRDGRIKKYTKVVGIIACRQDAPYNLFSSNRVFMSGYILSQGVVRKISRFMVYMRVAYPNTPIFLELGNSVDNETVQGVHVALYCVYV